MYRYVKQGYKKLLVKNTKGIEFNLGGVKIGESEINPIEYSSYPFVNVISILKTGSDHISIGFDGQQGFVEKSVRSKNYFKMTSKMCNLKPIDILRNTGEQEGIPFTQTVFIFGLNQNMSYVMENLLKEV